MPKDPEISPDYLSSRLKHYAIFNGKKLKGATDPIWKEIKTDLKLNMIPKSVFLYVYKNGNLKSQLESHFKIKVKQAKIRKANDVNYQPGIDINNPKNCKPLLFEIIVPTNNIINSSEEKPKVQNDWTNEVRAAIKEAQQLPCPFSIKTSHVTSNGCFKFDGYCSECKTGIIAESEDIGTDNLKILIRTYATHSIRHKLKNKLSGNRRQQMKKILRDRDAADVRLEGLGQVQTNYEPPDLNSTVVLRKAKEEENDEYIGYKEFKGWSISTKNLLHLCNVRKLSLSPAIGADLRET